MVKIKRTPVVFGVAVLILVICFGLLNSFTRTRVGHAEVNGQELKLILTLFENRLGYFSDQVDASYYQLITRDRVKDISVFKEAVRHDKEPTKDCLIARIVIQKAIGKTRKKSFVIDLSKSPVLMAEVSSGGS